MDRRISDYYFATTDGQSEVSVDSAVTDTERKDDKRRKQRMMILQELIETEQGYLADLTVLVKNFLEPLNDVYLDHVARYAAKVTEHATAETIRENKTFGNEISGNGWITFDQKQSISRNTHHLLKFQKLFLKQLQESKANVYAQGGEPTLIALAKCFVEAAPRMESLYVPYCAHHDIALETVTAIKKTHSWQFNSFVDGCRNKAHTRLEFNDFLIKPVQRICKYPLLLQELSKTSPSISEDKIELQRAIDAIRSILTRINDQKRLVENDRKKRLLVDRLNSGKTTISKLADIVVSRADDLNPSRPGSARTVNEILFDNLGQLLKGCAVVANDLGQHEMSLEPRPARTPFAVAGMFIFTNVILILLPRKADVYQLQFAFRPVEVVNIQELPIMESDHRFAFRLTWNFDVMYYSIEIAVKTLKDYNSIISVLQTVVSQEKFAFISESAENLAASSESTLASDKALNSPSSRPGTPLSHQDSTLSLEARFTDVFTTESLVNNMVPASLSKENSLRRNRSGASVNSRGTKSPIDRLSIQTSPAPSTRASEAQLERASSKSPLSKEAFTEKLETISPPFTVEPSLKPETSDLKVEVKPDKMEVIIPDPIITTVQVMVSPSPKPPTTPSPTSAKRISEIRMKHYQHRKPAEP